MAVQETTRGQVHPQVSHCGDSLLPSISPCISPCISYYLSPCLCSTLTFSFSSTLASYLPSNTYSFLSCLEHSTCPPTSVHGGGRPQSSSEKYSRPRHELLCDSLPVEDNHLNHVSHKLSFSQKSRQRKSVQYILGSEGCRVSRPMQRVSSNTFRSCSQGNL